MSWSIDTPGLRAALALWCAALHAATSELNTLDGQLGDGDLGTTLTRCAANVEAVLAQADAHKQPAELLRACAQACAKASGSSFGTLLAVAFLTAAKAVGDAPRLEPADLARVLSEVQSALCARGGAKLGDKTMVDSLAAIVDALERAPADATPGALAQAAHAATAAALDSFRGQPNRMGRARMFADRSVGLDDPGMVAVHRMTAALKPAQA